MLLSFVVLKVPVEAFIICHFSQNPMRQTKSIQDPQDMARTQQLYFLKEQIRNL